MDFREWVFVFDLDDTLISELEYQRSGVARVEEIVSSLYSVYFIGRIQKALDDGVVDIWGWTCSELGLPSQVKESLLWMYRLHEPTISMADDLKDLFSFLTANAANIAILTDGRSITQRLKLRAIGLDSFPLFISEDFGSVKPELARFISIENRWPECNYVYIADNPVKDFAAPRARNWLTIGARWISPRVHSSTSPIPPSNQPDQWLDCPFSILSIIDSA